MQAEIEGGMEKSSTTLCHQIIEIFIATFIFLSYIFYTKADNLAFLPPIHQGNYTGRQWFSNFSVAQNYLDSLMKC